MAIPKNIFLSNKIKNYQACYFIYTNHPFRIPEKTQNRLPHPGQPAGRPGFRGGQSPRRLRNGFMKLHGFDFFFVYNHKEQDGNGQSEELCNRKGNPYACNPPHF